jgi:hypothetical protein
MLAKLSTNQMAGYLFETAMTLSKQIELNYKDQFKIN